MVLRFLTLVEKPELPGTQARPLKREHELLVLVSQSRARSGWVCTCGKNCELDLLLQKKELLPLD